MDNIISKELLSEVLEFDINKFDFMRMSKDEKSIEFAFLLDEGMNVQNIFTINIHELAHKCKEWASHVKGYAIHSGYDHMEKKYWCGLMQQSFYADTEPEAISKACQWIYEKENQ